MNATFDDKGDLCFLTGPFVIKIVGLAPRTDQSFARWGFGIDMDFEFARLMRSQRISYPIRQKLTEIIRERLRPLYPTDRGYDLLDGYPRLNFWDDTCLLTNFSVPGNACGLDMDHADFSRLDREPSEYSKVSYHPHNVDSQVQAMALLIGMTTYVDYAATVYNWARKETTAAAPAGA